MPHLCGACSHGLGVLYHGDIPPPNAQDLSAKVDYRGILPQEWDTQYAVVAIDVSNIKIELGVKCPDLYLSIGSVSDARAAANTPSCRVSCCSRGNARMRCTVVNARLTKLLVLPISSIVRALWPSINVSIMTQACELAGTSGRSVDVGAVFAFSAYLKAQGSRSAFIAAILV